MIIDKNVNKVGFGSWYSTQSFLDYEEKMTYPEFRDYITTECFNRSRKLIADGDIVKVQYMGGNSPRYFTGTVTSMSYDTRFQDGYILLQQKKTVKVIQTCFIDDIIVLSNAQPDPVVEPVKLTKKQGEVIRHVQELEKKEKCTIYFWYNPTSRMIHPVQLMTPKGVLPSIKVFPMMCSHSVASLMEEKQLLIPEKIHDTLSLCVLNKERLREMEVRE